MKKSEMDRVLDAIDAKIAVLNAARQEVLDTHASIKPKKRRTGPPLPPKGSVPLPMDPPELVPDEEIRF